MTEFHNHIPIKFMNFLFINFINHWGLVEVIQLVEQILVIGKHSHLVDLLAHAH